MGKLKILITNDDGVYAPGIKKLYETLSEVADVTMVAPLEERSTTGHTLTLDHPLRLVEIGKNIYGLSGYPADCTIMGLAHVMKSRPDLVISGINRGANLGQDIYYSGTVAAAREAAFHSVPSIAVSTDIDYKDHVGKVHFHTAANFIKKIILNNIHQYIDPLHMININVPNREEHLINGVGIGTLGLRRYSEEVDARIDFKDRQYFWIGGVYQGFDHTQTGTDCSIVHQGKISFVPLNLMSGGTDQFPKWQSFLDQLN